MKTVLSIGSGLTCSRPLMRTALLKLGTSISLPWGSVAPFPSLVLGRDFPPLLGSSSPGLRCPECLRTGLNHLRPCVNQSFLSLQWHLHHLGNLHICSLLCWSCHCR